MIRSVTTLTKKVFLQRGPFLLFNIIIFYMFSNSFRYIRWKSTPVESWCWNESLKPIHKYFSFSWKNNYSLFLWCRILFSCPYFLLRLGSPGSKKGLRVCLWAFSVNYPLVFLCVFLNPAFLRIQSKQSTEKLQSKFCGKGDRSVRDSQSKR